MTEFLLFCYVLFCCHARVECSFIFFCCVPCMFLCSVLRFHPLIPSFICCMFLVLCSFSLLYLVSCSFVSFLFPSCSFVLLIQLSSSICSSTRSLVLPSVPEHASVEPVISSFSVFSTSVQYVDLMQVSFVCSFI